MVKNIKHKLRKTVNSRFLTILEKIVIILAMINFLGWFWACWKANETLVLPKMYGLEFQLKIAF
jgi:hypothetical protein